MASGEDSAPFVSCAEIHVPRAPVGTRRGMCTVATAGRSMASASSTTKFGLIACVVVNEPDEPATVVGAAAVRISDEDELARGAAVAEVVPSDVLR